MSISLRYIIARIAGLTMVAMLALAPAGCAVAALVGKAVIPEVPVPAAYKGLQNQNVGVMVWADRGVTIDYPTVRLDLARRIETNLRQAQDAGIDDVKQATWTKSEKIVRFQDDHPELDGMDVQTIAPMVTGVTRLIYVEITSLSLHPSDAVDLWRGVVTANIKVYEVKDGAAKSAFAEDNITAIYPPKSDPEGVSDQTDDKVYSESMNEIGKAVAMRFVSHEADAQ